jgi:hypothetical protein
MPVFWTVYLYDNKWATQRFQRHLSAGSVATPVGGNTMVQRFRMTTALDYFMQLLYTLVILDL